MKLNYDTLSVLETKTLLHISKITRVIYSRKVKDVNRNIESVTVLGVIMQIKLAIKRLKQLIQLHCEGENLTEFQLNSMEIADTYLREIILGKNLKKFDLTTKTVDEIYDVMAYIRNMQFPHLPKCFWCENSKYPSPVVFNSDYSIIFLIDYRYFRFCLFSPTYRYKMCHIFYANNRSCLL